MAQRLKHLPAIQETWVQSLGQEDPLEKELATHSSTLAWNGTPLEYSCLENSMDRGAWLSYSPWVRKESDTTEHLSTRILRASLVAQMKKNLPAVQETWV